MRSLVLTCIAGLSLVSGELTFIDLTHGLGENTIYWPSNPPFNMTLLSNRSAYGTVVIGNYIGTPEHIGTHIDAPRHFCPQGKYVHELSIDQLSGPGVVLDFQSQADDNYDYLVTLQDVKDWEAKNGLIPQGAIVLLKYGWNKYWPNWNQYFKTDDMGNFSSFHWPGLTLEASEHIAGTRRVNAVGSDTVSGDPGQGYPKPIHLNMLCEHGVIIIENVGNIDAMPTTGSRVYIGAMKLVNGGGTPVRLFAVVNDGDPNASGAITPGPLCGILLGFMLMYF